jgi:hypothetical protein
VGLKRGSSAVTWMPKPLRRDSSAAYWAMKRIVALAPA